jgi:hypothetical protein
MSDYRCAICRALIDRDLIVPLVEIHPGVEQ